MAENKQQYIVQRQKGGAVMISSEVIATIAAQAIYEVEGIVGLNSKPSTDVIEVVGKRNRSKAIKVVIDENNDVNIACNITVLYGTSVVTAANAAQDAIRGAVEAMTGIDLKVINVNVCAIVRK